MIARRRWSTRSSLRPGHREEARPTLGRALTLDPTCAKDPRGAFRLHRTPENPIAQFTQELRKAGLDDPTAQTPTRSDN